MPPGHGRFPLGEDVPVAGNLDGARDVEGAVVGRPLDDEQLVERARRGDADAYGELVRRHQAVAYRTALVIAGSTSEAEEAAQDAFVKAWRALGRFRAGAPFRPWVLAIVANEARTRRRAAGRREAWTLRAAAQASAAAPPAASGDPAAAVLVRERAHAMRAGLARLEERDRTVLALRYLLDLSEREMAAVLDCRPGTVKSRLSRALDRLREEVA
jgi:RNA polymerase sigma-70 factor (ECF subfamily)